jgi:hypothetical protein
MWRVIMPSSHYTFRAWFLCPDHHASHVRVLDTATQLGCVWEWFGTQLLALDAPTPEIAQRPADDLQAFEDAHVLEYETGLTQHRTPPPPPGSILPITPAQ